MKIFRFLTIHFVFSAAILLLCGMALPQAACAQTEDNEVQISDCEDVYEFVARAGGDIVRNRITATYETLRKYPVHLQPATFYGEFITLDGSSGKGAAQYRSATPENVFYDDSKVCYYDIHLNIKKREQRVSFSRTFLDLRYFTRVMLSEPFFVKSKSVRFIIPDELSQYELVEMNFEGSNIQKDVERKDGKTIVTYTVRGLPAMKNEKRMPAATNVYPCVLIKGAFRDWQDMFLWSRTLSDVDTSIPSLDAIIAETGPQSASKLEKMSNTLAWVQRNIRYIAFEAGLSGHKPDTPSEVVRKRYGDCKGMSLLLKTLLQAQGIDARLTDIGTTDVGCRMSDVATLAAVNHAICTALVDGRFYYLDATNKYIPYTHIPSSIQGQQATIEEGDRGRLITVPLLPIGASTDSMAFGYAVDGRMLTGMVQRWVSGDMKQSLMAALNAEEGTDRADLERKLLSPGSSVMAEVGNVTWTGNTPQSEWAVLKAAVRNGHALQQADGELYVELNPSGNDLFADVIDTLKRQNDYLLPIVCRIVREARLQLPKGHRATYLPEPFTLTTDNAVMQRTVMVEGETVVFRKSIDITRRLIPRSELPQWNAAIRKWQDACHEQVVIAQQ